MAVLQLKAKTNKIQKKESRAKLYPSGKKTETIQKLDPVNCKSTNYSSI